jgi:large subunit ribosomal protein L31e
MAKEKKKEEKVILERTYNVPLRRQFLKSPKYKRAKKAMNTLKEFLVKHMKSDKILVGRHANMKIWERGIKSPPHHIKIVAKKYEDGTVKAELEGAPEEKPVEPVKKKAAKEEPKAEKKEEPKKEGEESIEDEFKKLEEKTEKIKEDKAEKGKEIQKEEIKELQKEKPKQHAPKEAAKEKKVEMKPNAPKGKGEMSKP